MSLNCDSEKGFGMISVIFSMIALSILGLALTPIIVNLSRGSLLELRGHQAFYVADGGLSFIVTKEFMSDADFSDNVSPTGAPFGGTPISLGEGQFWVEYSNLTTDSADVLVTSRVGESVRKVQATVKSGSSAVAAVGSGGNVRFGIDAGGDGTINGGVIYAGSFANRFTISGTVQHDSSYAPSPVDLQRLIDLTTSTHTGNLTINGNFSDNVHVTGNVKINSSGSPDTVTGIIVADGNVTIKGSGASTLNFNGAIGAAGNLKIQMIQASSGTFDSQADPGGGMLPIFLSEGNFQMIIAEALDFAVRGLIHSDAKIIINVESASDVTLDGALLAGGDVDLESTMASDFTINFDEGSLISSSEMTVENWKEV